MKFGVIGLGNISHRHRANFKKIAPDSMVYALSASGRVLDLLPDHCDVMANSIEDLIAAQLDMVIIASPAPNHLQHAQAFIAAGIPTLIEKPLCSDIADIAPLVQAEAQASAAVGVGYCLRFLPSMQVVKSFIEQGQLGTLYQAKIEVGQYLPDWRPKDFRTTVSAQAHLGGGALLELSHDIDYAQWLLGDLTLHSALLKSSVELGLSVEDSADVLASTPDQVPVYIHLDFLQRKANRVCILIGSEGRLEWDLIQNSVTLVRPSVTDILYAEPGWDKNQMYLNMVNTVLDSKHPEQSKLATVQQAVSCVEFIHQVKSKAVYL